MCFCDCTAISFFFIDAVFHSSAYTVSRVERMSPQSAQSRASCIQRSEKKLLEFSATLNNILLPVLLLPCNYEHSSHPRAFSVLGLASAVQFCIDLNVSVLLCV